MRRPVLKDALCSVVALAYSLPAWAYPFGNDQALHWYIGRRWLDGELPFVSAISSKPIGMFSVHALSTALFGQSMRAIRITESFTVLLVGWLLGLATRPAGQPAKDGEMGLGALVFAGLYYTFFDYWDTAHPELWEATCALAGWVVALRAPTPWKRDAGAGALATAAFMFKFPAALPALGISALCAVRAVRERPANENFVLSLIFAAGRFLCGVVPVVFLCVLPFWIGGKLDTMWEILGIYIFHYAEQAPPNTRIPQWLRIEHGGALLVTTLVLTVVAWVLARERQDRDAQWRTAWLALGAVLASGTVIMQGRYFTYHFVAMGASLGALCVLGLRELSREHAAPSWLKLGGVVVAVALAFNAGPLWTSGRDQNYKRFTKSLIGYLGGTVSREDMLRPFVGRRPLDSSVAMERVARVVNGFKQPGDTLCTRGFLTPLYPLTGLRCTSRHIVEDNVGSGLPDWKREYKETLEKRKPTFLVTFADRQRDISYLRGLGYVQAARDGMYVVMSLRDPKAKPGDVHAPSALAPTGS